jgi:hypothetical protein
LLKPDARPTGAPQAFHDRGGDPVVYAAPCAGPSAECVPIFKSCVLKLAGKSIPGYLHPRRTRGFPRSVHRARTVLFQSDAKFSTTGYKSVLGMSESAAIIKLFFRSIVAEDCYGGYTKSGRSGG